MPLDQLRLGWGGKSLKLGLPGGLALSSRERFDQALVNAAEGAGATLRFRTSAVLEEMTPEGRTVRLRPPSGAPVERISGRVVLVAAGLEHQVISPSHAASSKSTPESRLGAGCLIADDDGTYEPGTIHMAIGQHGYVGLVRREDGALNLAGRFRPRFGQVFRRCGACGTTCSDSSRLRLASIFGVVSLAINPRTDPSCRCVCRASLFVARRCDRLRGAFYR